MPDDYTVTISADVSGLTGAMEEAGAATEQLKGQLESVGEGASGAEEGFGELGEGLGELKEHMDGALEGLTSMAGGWEGLLGLIGGGAIAELMANISETTMEVGDAMRNTAAALNIGQDDARGFNEAMSSLGVQSNAATQAIRRLEMDASAGGKQMARLGVSATDASGQTKSAAELFDEVTQKINNLADSSQKGEAAFTLLGRGGIQLLGVLPEIKAALESYDEEQEKNSATNALAAKNSLALHNVLTQLKSAWEDAVINISPLVISALQGIAAEMGAIRDIIMEDVTACHTLATAFGELGAAAAKGMQEAGAAIVKFQQDKANLAHDIQTRLAGNTGAFGHMGEEGLGTSMLTGGPPFGAMGEQGMGVQATPGDAGGVWAPKGGGGGKGGKGGGGGGDSMAGMDDALVSSNNEMQKLNQEFAKMGSEAQMASKASSLSFDTLKTAATQAYNEMQSDYQKWAAAVKSGDVEAAKAFEKDWKDATKAFQTDFDQLKQKATQDMQQIKQVSDQISSEISGVLNSAISGKLNWAQEFDKILEKMTSSLLKHLAQQIAMWIANGQQTNAARAAANAAGLSQQKAANAAAGTSDAVTAAKGAYSSAAQVPYIGFIIAPFAAAAAFAGVEAFGSAAGGAEIGPRSSPMLQLHPNELVLPAQHADTIRRLGAMGSMGGSGNTANLTMNMNSLDPRGMNQLFMDNHNMVGSVVARAMRSGAPFYTG